MKKIILSLTVVLIFISSITVAEESQVKSRNFDCNSTKIGDDIIIDCDKGRVVFLKANLPINLSTLKEMAEKQGDNYIRESININMIPTFLSYLVNDSDIFQYKGERAVDFTMGVIGYLLSAISDGNYKEIYQIYTKFYDDFKKKNITNSKNDEEEITRDLVILKMFSHELNTFLENEKTMLINIEANAELFYHFYNKKAVFDDKAANIAFGFFIDYDNKNPLKNKYSFKNTCTNEITKHDCKVHFYAHLLTFNSERFYNLVTISYAKEGRNVTPAEVFASTKSVSDKNNVPIGRFILEYENFESALKEEHMPNLLKYFSTNKISYTLKSEEDTKDKVEEQAKPNKGGAK